MSAITPFGDRTREGIAPGAAVLARRPVQAVVGGGYAGLAAAMAARKAQLRLLQGKTSPATGGRRLAPGPGLPDVVLITPTSHQTLVTQLYRVAAGTLPPAAAQMDLDPILAAYGIRPIYTRVTGLDWERRQLYLASDSAPVHYDQLVLAAGSQVESFGVPGVIEHAFPLYTLAQAQQVANLVAQLRLHPEGPPLAIVGGGLAGVEFAAELAETLPAHLDAAKGTLCRPVVLVEAMPRLLPGLPAPAAQRAEEYLRGRGVQIRLGHPVAQVAAQELILRDGSRIPAHCTVWAAGVRGQTAWLPAAARDQHDRLRVNSYLQLVDHPEVFAAGDIAQVVPEGRSQPDAPTAQNAIAQGAVAGLNLARLAVGRPPVPYRPRHLGLLFSLGSRQGVGVFGRASFSGHSWRWLKEAVEAHYVVSVGGLGALLLQRLAASGPQVPPELAALPPA